MKRKIGFEVQRTLTGSLTRIGKTARKDETQDWVLSSENLTSSLTCIGKTARKDDTLGIGLDEG